MDHVDRDKGRAAVGLTPVRAVERAFGLLACFSRERMWLSLTELARASGLDKGTARRMLQTLMRLDMIEHDERTQRYCLGVGALMLSAFVPRGRDLREAAAPNLAKLAERTGATAYLFMPHRGLSLCIDRVRAPAPGFDASWWEVGGVMPLNCGGASRVILAYLPDEERALALSHPMPRRTSFSETDPAELEKAAIRIRSRGYEVAIDDFHIGMCGIGVPVMDGSGRLVAAVSIASLTSLIAPDGEPRHLDALHAAALEIGRRLPPSSAA